MTMLPPPSTGHAYFLDVDGTLIDLAPTPNGIRVDRNLAWLIEDVYRRCDGALALISGRALADLDLRLPMAHLPMAGLHGLEWRLAAGAIQRHSAGKSDIRSVHRQLLALCRRYPSLIVEDKGIALALHYRSAPHLGSYLHRRVRALVDLAGGDLQIQPGKYVIEVKPSGCDKGSAIETFMADAPFAGRPPVFIGDDQTDEHGFVVVNRLGGISIKVGRGRSQASYRLPNVAAVLGWLAQLGAHESAVGKEETNAVA